MDTEKFKHKEITDIILKSFYEVYNELGDGFLESVYENALYIVLTGHGLCVERQKDIPDSKDLYMIIKQKISVMISVNLWLNNYEIIINVRRNICLKKSLCR